MKNTQGLNKKAELELVNKAREGDNDAFKEIILKYENQVAATVIGMLGHCTESEDIGQETFIRFYRSLDKFRGESSVGTYLTRIAINLSLNEIKRRQKRRKRYLSNPENSLENIPEKKSAEKERDNKKIVQSAIQKLDPKFRAVIVLRLIDGYSTQETAKILKLPVGTVLSRLARGQIKLKEILQSFYGEKEIMNNGEEI
jgi:RNA polymerase sigma-70 factor (ECF subfamily)